LYPATHPNPQPQPKFFFLTPSDTLEAPVVFDELLFNFMQEDSMHEYGAGDCFGTVRKYSSKAWSLAFDSLSCGEYGYTHTVYFFDTQGQILAVQTVGSSTIFENSLGVTFFLLSEQIIDFRPEIPRHWSRVDTALDYDDKFIVAPFAQEPLENVDSVYQELLSNLKGAWEMDLDY
ncbi:MAG TPA: hypothetical protein DCR93_37490, partial [Cytophagales bacterium]|nr:hypothetical protein [Cytophagales bacterium]